MKLLRPSFLLIFLFILGGIIFKESTPNDCAQILSDDSMFVLTGDTRRIPFAIRKMEKYPDADLYIIGAMPNYQYTGNATVESESKTTYQNAIAIRKIVTKANLDRIVVITTEDHANRSGHLIRKQLPQTAVIMCPVPLFDMSAPHRLERWTTEYIKYIATVFGLTEAPSFLQ